jgi:hypothetical protein
MTMMVMMIIVSSSRLQMARIGAFLGCPPADVEFGRPESSLYGCCEQPQSLLLYRRNSSLESIVSESVEMTI